MENNTKFKEAFTAGANFLIDEMEWGAQARVAKLANMKPSYFCDILKGRRFGTEETRKAISCALGKSYEEIIQIGFNLIEVGDPMIQQACKDLRPFSEDRAACIYGLAAEHCGINGSFFFSGDSLKKLRPPGWAEYTSANISDGEFYEAARKEIKIQRAGLKESQHQTGCLKEICADRELSDKKQQKKVVQNRRRIAFRQSLIRASFGLMILGKRYNNFNSFWRDCMKIEPTCEGFSSAPKSKYYNNRRMSPARILTSNRY